MRRSRTDSIGLVVSDGGEPAFAEMIRGVEETAASQGITLLLANSADNPQREARAVQALLERRVDGLVLARAAGATAAELLTKRIADNSAEHAVVRLAPTIEYRASSGAGPAS
ncbi:MAG TPA: hypothetical protein VJ617_04145 [Arthrobacter sp.]|nr:hypothetical protein [Arthrobacter sp.]